MKNPWEWDENDLLDMMKAGTQESIELDFKESKALERMPSRMLCSGVEQESMETRLANVCA